MRSEEKNIIFSLKFILSLNKYKNKSYCVGGKHYSATTNIRGDITQNKKLACQLNN